MDNEGSDTESQRNSDGEEMVEVLLKAWKNQKGTMMVKGLQRSNTKNPGAKLMVKK